MVETCAGENGEMLIFKYDYIDFRVTFLAGPLGPGDSSADLFDMSGDLWDPWSMASPLSPLSYAIISLE